MRSSGDESTIACPQDLQSRLCQPQHLENLVKAFFPQADPKKLREELCQTKDDHLKEEACQFVRGLVPKNASNNSLTCRQVEDIIGPINWGGNFFNQTAEEPRIAALRKTLPNQLKSSFLFEDTNALVNKTLKDLCSQNRYFRFNLVDPEKYFLMKATEEKVKLEKDEKPFEISILYFEEPTDGQSLPENHFSRSMGRATIAIFKASILKKLNAVSSKLARPQLPPQLGGIRESEWHKLAGTTLDAYGLKVGEEILPNHPIVQDALLLQKRHELDHLLNGEWQNFATFTQAAKTATDEDSIVKVWELFKEAWELRAENAAILPDVDNLRNNPRNKQSYRRLLLWSLLKGRSEFQGIDGPAGRAATTINNLLLASYNSSKKSFRVKTLEGALNKVKEYTQSYFSELIEKLKTFVLEGIKAGLDENYRNNFDQFQLNRLVADMLNTDPKTKGKWNKNGPIIYKEHLNRAALRMAAENESSLEFARDIFDWLVRQEIRLAQFRNQFPVAQSSPSVAE